MIAVAKAAGVAVAGEVAKAAGVAVAGAGAEAAAVERATCSDSCLPQDYGGCSQKSHIERLRIILLVSSEGTFWTLRLANLLKAGLLRGAAQHTQSKSSGAPREPQNATTARKSNLKRKLLAMLAQWPYRPPF